MFNKYNKTSITGKRIPIISFLKQKNHSFITPPLFFTYGSNTNGNGANSVSNTDKQEDGEKKGLEGNLSIFGSTRTMCLDDT